MSAVLQCDRRVLGAERIGHLPLEGALVELLCLEGHREGAKAVGLDLLRDGRDDRGIEPAGEISSDRDVRPQPDPRCVGQQHAQLVSNIGLTAASERIGVAEGKLPIRAYRHVAVLGDQHVRRRKLGNSLERGARAQRKPEGEDLVERERIELCAHSGHCQQRLDLRSEIKAARVGGVVERPDSHPVARHHQALATLVPDREGEIAVEVRNAIDPLLLVELEENLGVGIGSKVMTALDHRLAQFDVVEDFAVEGDADVAICTQHRLLAGRDVDDAQPCVAETRVTVEMDAVFVRTAMIQRANHPREHHLVLEARWSTVEAGNATHLRTAFRPDEVTSPIPQKGYDAVGNATI